MPPDAAGRTRSGRRSAIDSRCPRCPSRRGREPCPSDPPSRRRRGSRRGRRGPRSGHQGRGPPAIRWSCLVPSVGGGVSMAERGPSAAHARIVRMTELSPHPPPPERPPLPVPSRTALVGQVNQRLKGWEAVRWVDGAPQVTDELRAEVDRFGGIGALYGVLRADPWAAVRWGSGIPPERSAEAYAAVQEHVTRYGDGIPVLFVEEAPHGLMALGGTTLPVNLALGAGMDADLARKLGEAVAAEARERGTHLLLVSGLDVLRDPRWGRAEECFSEDPAIAAMLVEATVQGMQGAAAGERIDAEHVAVVAKHLAGQGAGIGGRNGSGAP